MRSTCSWVSSVSSPEAGSAALAMRISTVARLIEQARHLVALGQVAGDRPAAELGRERLEHIDAPRAEHDRRTAGGDRARDRLADPARGAGDEDVAGQCRHGGAV